MSVPTKMTIDGVDFVRADSVKSQQPQHDKVVLVRCDHAGVHVGELVSQNGQTVVLKNATRVWRWKGANTLHELAIKGGDTGYTRISEAVTEISLLDALEVIRCSVVGATNLLQSRWPA